MIPPELRESMTRTIDCVIEFILDTLDSSPEETVPPKDEADLKRLLLPLDRGAPLATVLWNDEKHSFTEVVSALCELIGCSSKEGLKIAELIDNEVRPVRSSAYATIEYEYLIRAELSSSHQTTFHECFT